MDTIYFELLHAAREVCKANKAPIRVISNRHMIHYIEDGYGYFNGIKLGKGNGFICKKGVYCEYFPDPNFPWTYSYYDILGLEADNIVNKVFTNKDNIFLWNLNDCNLLKQLCSDLVNSTGISSSLYKRSIVYKLLANLACQYYIPRQNDYFENAKRIFALNIEKKIKIADVANTLHISRSYLRKIFIKELGFSPQEYLINLRMQNAIQLLKNDYSINEISRAIGYNDSFEFTKAFNKYFGKSPSKYRAEIKNILSSQE